MIDPSAAAFAASAPAQLSAVMAQNQAWLTALEQERDLSESVGESNLNEMPPLGIDGAGLFVLNDHGTLLYSRVGKFHVADDGRLLDRREREVVGFSSHDPAARPSTLRVPASDLAAGRFSRYDIDERGRLLGIHRSSGRRGASAEQAVELGRLGIAVFPAPERLALRDADSAAATKDAGTPHYLPAGSPHTGAIQRHPLRPTPDAVRANLRALWSASAHAELEVAMAATDDALSRIALNLVK